MPATTGGFLLRGVIAGTIGAWIMDRATWAFQDRQAHNILHRERRAWREGLDVPHALVYRLGRTLGLRPKRAQPSTLGILTHYLLSIGPAIAYAALRERDPRFGADRGLLYGLIIFVLWDELLSAATGVASPPRAYPWQTHLRGLVGHLSLGLASHIALSALETDFNVNPLKWHPGAAEPIRPLA